MVEDRGRHERGEGRLSAPADSLARHCRDLVRAGDRDRFLAHLFAPAEARPHLDALAAFALDLGGIRAKVSDPILGTFRLQWWRDAIEGFAAGVASGNPVADALARAVRDRNLPTDRLAAMVEAREADLDPAPMAGLEALERHLGASEGTLFALTARVLDPTGASEEAARAAGLARGMAILIAEAATKPWRANLLPADLMAVHGLDPAAPYDPHAAATRTLVADLAATARGHLARARAALRDAPDTILPAFLPLATVALDLRRSERDAGAGPGGQPFRRQVAIWRAARRGLARL